MAMSPDPTNDGSDLPAPGPWNRSDFRRLATLVIPRADPPLLSRIAHALITSCQTKQPTFCQYSIRLFPTLLDHSEIHRSAAVQALCQFASNEDPNIISAARGAMSLLMHTRPAATAIQILRFHRILSYTKQTRPPELLIEWIKRASSLARAVPTDMDTWERSTETTLQLRRTIPHLHSSQDGFLAWGPQMSDLTAPPQLTIVSWNANSFRARYNNGDLAHLLADMKPHVLLLQEMKMPCSDNDRTPLASFCETQALMVNLGYCHGAVHWSTDTNGPHHNGVAIFSKFPCTFRPGLYGCAIPSTFDNQGRALTATFTDVIITNFYAPTTHNDTSRDACRQQWDIDLNSHILFLTSQAPVIAGGDWNVTPDPGFDSTIRLRNTEGPDPGTKQFETEAHSRLLDASKLQNCFHYFHNAQRIAQQSKGEHLTWFRSERDQHRGSGKALDHFLASPSLFANPQSDKGLRIQECSIVRSTLNTTVTTARSN
jgi:exodeoxyribonuclease III